MSTTKVSSLSLREGIESWDCELFWIEDWEFGWRDVLRVCVDVCLFSRISPGSPSETLSLISDAGGRFSNSSVCWLVLHRPLSVIYEWNDCETVMSEKHALADQALRRLMAS
jgi:hypothetical protein